MKSQYIVAGIAASLLIATPAAAADNRPDCAATPRNIEGQVVRIDQNQGKVTIRASDGTTHEFNASKDTLQGYKMGDTIRASLRSAPPGCDNRK